MNFKNFYQVSLILSLFEWLPKAFWALIVSVFIVFSGNAQEVSLSIEKTEIGENEMLQITATVKNDRLKKYSNFPDIQGFRKSGTSSSTNTNIINGRITTSQSITQNYLPNRQGTFKVPAFEMEINAKKARFPSTTVKVGPPVNRRAYDPFADFWGDNNRKRDREFVDVKEDAFFSVSTNKKDVFVGESFTVDISFYVALSNQAKMSFHKIGDQLAEISKKIKPANCWEENFGIDQIEPEYVTINNKQYRRYKIYEGAFFPLNAEDIILPSVGLKMIKYKQAKRPTFFGRNTQEDFKTFYSQERKVKVQELPPHPLREGVAVGQYRLVENTDAKTFETGKSFTYDFKVQGEGNISALNEPKLPRNEAFIFYPPSVNQKVTRANGRVYGTKSFEYYVEPQEPGKYKLGDYLQWIYFDPSREQYDTLRSNLNLIVTGESKRNSYIADNDLGGFYDLINLESNDLRKTTDSHFIKLLTNVGILSLLLGTVFITIFWKKRKTKSAR